MSTKTVKLNASLHEELKGIAEQDGLVLQDLIEEKLTEVLEEKGVYNFDPSNVSFSPSDQLFTLKLSPSNFQALIIMIKRLCLNEKISNLSQMYNLLDAIKKMENVFESNKTQMDKIDDFLKGGQNLIMSLITSQDKGYNVEPVIESKSDSELEPVYSPAQLSISDDAEQLLTTFASQAIENVTNEFRRKLILTDFKANIFKISKLKYVNSLQFGNPLTGEEYRKISDKLYYLFTKTDNVSHILTDEYVYFAGDFYEFKSKFNSMLTYDDVHPVAFNDLVKELFPDSYTTMISK